MSDSRTKRVANLVRELATAIEGQDADVGIHATLHAAAMAIACGVETMEQADAILSLAGPMLAEITARNFESRHLPPETLVDPGKIRPFDIPPSPESEAITAMANQILESMEGVSARQAYGALTHALALVIVNCSKDRHEAMRWSDKLGLDLVDDVVEGLEKLETRNVN